MIQSIVDLVGVGAVVWVIGYLCVLHVRHRLRRRAERARLADIAYEAQKRADLVALGSVRIVLSDPLQQPNGRFERRSKMRLAQDVAERAARKERDERNGEQEESEMGGDIDDFDLRLAIATVLLLAIVAAGILWWNQMLG